MFTIAFCLSCLSVYCLYTISDKIEVEKKGILLFLQERKTLARFLAGSTFVLSTLILSTQVGPAVGILTSVMLWTVLACSIILFMPFEKVNWSYWAIGVLVSAVIEVGVPMM